jgi:hypothetical protein
MGWSERGPLPRDLKQHVGELHALPPEPDRRTIRHGWSFVRGRVPCIVCARSTQARGRVAL